MTDLRKNVRAANAVSENLQKNVGRVFQTALKGSAELASVQTKHLDESSMLAAELQQSLIGMRNVDVHDLLMVIKHMHGQLVSRRRESRDTSLITSIQQATNEIMSLVATRQNNVASVGVKNRL